MVTIGFAGSRWTVGIYLFSNQCRFEKEWNEFVGDNSFQVGDRLKFTHVCGSIFEVCYANEM